METLAAKQVKDLVVRLADRHGHRDATVPSAIPGPPLPYLPWFPSDFYGSPLVEAMPDRQQNWYRRLLDKSWQMPQPCFLPNDPVIIAGICRCTPLDLQGEGALIIAKFEKTDDGKFLYNRRLLREYCKQRKAYEGRAQAGKDSAAKRSHGAQRNGDRTVTVAGASVERDAQPQQLITHNHNHKEHIKPTSLVRFANEIYELYPRRVGKGAALKAIEKALALICRTRNVSEDEAATVLRESVHEFAASPAGNRGEYTPHCATWMNQQRWNDDRQEWHRETEVSNGNQNHTTKAVTNLNAAERRTVNNLSATQRALQRERDRRQEGSDHPGSDPAGSGS